MCSSLTTARTYEGWVEMDIKLAVSIWKNSSRNFGLAIEVHDPTDDTQLKASSFFKDQECTVEACKCEV